MQTINKIFRSRAALSNIFGTHESCSPVECPFTENTSPEGPGRINTMRLITGGIFFLILSIVVFKYQFNQIHADHTFSMLKKFELGYLFILLPVIPLDTLAGAMRIWIISYIIQPGVTFRTCLKADLANIGTGILTPSQTGGGLGQIYILWQKGVSIGSATAISFISFTGTMVALFCIGLYSLFFSDISSADVIFRSAVVIFISVSLSMLFVLIFPGLFRRIILKASIIFRCHRTGSYLFRNLCLSGNHNKNESANHDKSGLSERIIEIMHIYRNCICHYLRVGKLNFIWVLILSFAFLFSRSLMAFLCLRFLGIHQSSLGYIVETQLVLLFLIYFAPTPGGSGISEFMSLIVMSTLVPEGIAPYYNLLWRATTLYLPAVAGLIFLSHAVLVQGRKALIKRNPGNSRDKDGPKV